jgi:hypothetical protein
MIYPSFEDFYKQNEAVLTENNIDKATAQARYTAVCGLGLMPLNSIQLGRVLASTVEATQTVAGLSEALGEAEKKANDLADQLTAKDTQINDLKATIAELTSKLPTA